MPKGRKDSRGLSELRARLMEVLTDHIGAQNPVGMGELYEQVYGRPWSHRINDTRALRHLITDLRSRGVRICSIQDRLSPGYYLASTGGELENYVERLKKAALGKLARAAELQKVSLPRLLGQLQLQLGREGNEAS